MFNLLSHSTSSGPLRDRTETGFTAGFDWRRRREIEWGGGGERERDGEQGEREREKRMKKGGGGEVEMVAEMWILYPVPGS